MMSRQMVDAVIQDSEYNRFSKGIFSWVGFHTKGWLMKMWGEVLGKPNGHSGNFSNIPLREFWPIRRFLLFIICYGHSNVWSIVYSFSVHLYPCITLWRFCGRLAITGLHHYTSWWIDSTCLGNYGALYS